MSRANVNKSELVAISNLLKDNIDAIKEINTYLMKQTLALEGSGHWRDDQFQRLVLVVGTVKENLNQFKSKLEKANEDLKKIIDAISGYENVNFIGIDFGNLREGVNPPDVAESNSSSIRNWTSSEHSDSEQNIEIEGPWQRR